MVARLEAVLSAHQLDATWLKEQRCVAWTPVPTMPGFEEARLTDDFVKIFSSTEICNILEDLNIKI